jgi:putative transposase
MTYRKTLIFKLYRCKHEHRLHQMIRIGGVIHNHCIALHRRYYRRYQQSLSLYQLQAHLAKRKKLPKYAWWNGLGSQAIQDIVRRIDQGYQRFFQNVKDRKSGKTTRRIGPPSFRKVSKAKSFTLSQCGWKLLGGNRLRIGTTIYKFAKSREIAGLIKTVTIKRDALGDLFVYFSCIIAPQPINRVMTGHSAGFDFGLTTYLTGSDGTEHHAPQPLKHALRRLAQANRQVSHKIKGSNNRRKAVRHLARVHRRLAHLRQAFHWQKARELCLRYDEISLETLNLQGMKAMWGRKVSDLGFAGFVDILHHVASTTGASVQHVDRWFPSTKRCHVCRHVNAHITLRDCIWTCVHCHTMHRRDQNAAINIHREGASSRGGDPVSLASASVG